VSAPLRPFFKYYGSKHNVSHLLPAPEHPLLVEPFAGSAGYALRYPDRQVVLVERDPVIAGIWRYLIDAAGRADGAREILVLPDLRPDGSIEDVDAPWPARHLIGFWLNRGGVTHHNYRPSAWMKLWLEEGRRDCSFWGPAARERIAEQLPAIRHWKVFHASYADCPDREATWFVDPPYLGGSSTFRGLGSYYRINARTIDYGHLGRWCRRRRGQIIVCEGSGARWLPFTSDGAPRGHVAWQKPARARELA
jgi:hypothetical protein